MPAKPRKLTYNPLEMIVSGDEIAPTGPVTAPPDEISEHAGFDMLNAELTSFARAIHCSHGVTST